MKLSNFLIIALLGSFFMVAACNSKKEDPATEQTTTSPTVGTQDPSTTAATPVSSGFHYICPKGCEGGGGAAQGKCPVCGTDMVHNQAFHNQSPTDPGSSPQSSIQVDPANTTGTTTPNTQPPAAQNAKGEWHFACTKEGCGGGAGVAGNCPKCGTPLTHNAAFHQ